MVELLTEDTGNRDEQDGVTALHNGRNPTNVGTKGRKNILELRTIFTKKVRTKVPNR